MYKYINILFKFLFNLNQNILFNFGSVKGEYIGIIDLPERLKIKMHTKPLVLK